MKKILEVIKDKFYEWFSLDYRSLAFMRIGVGLVILLDLIQRSGDLVAHYSDKGILPRSELLRLWDNQWWISLHMISGLWEVQVLLFLIAGVCALMLIFGYRTRFAMIASWFMLVSIHVRNPVILQGGDIVFRAVLFWMMLLPLNRVWSIDRLFNRVPRPKEKTVFSGATIAYIVQICLVYIFTGILKTGDAWHVDGTAVYYTLHIEQLVTPIGVILREFPNLMQVLTFFVLYLEIYGSLLLFSPIATSFMRTLAVVLFAFLQIGFNSALRLGLFGAIMITITFGLLPSDFWDKGIKRINTWITSRAKSGLTIYYDFDCTFCYKLSFLLKRVFCLHPDTIVISAQTNESVQKIMDEQNSWVVTDKEGRTYTEWAGVYTVLGHSPLFFWLAPLLKLDFISSIGTIIYRYIARNRKQVCVPEPIEPEKTNYQKKLTIMGSIFVLILLTYVIFWNINTLDKSKKLILTKDMEWLGWLTHLDQEFNMFAPSPMTEDGWYVFPGKLRDGTEVNAFTGETGVSYSKPEWVSYVYKNQRWQKYLMNLWGSNMSGFRLGYGRYICREWNKSHPHEKELLSFDMIFLIEKTPAPGNEPEPVKPTTIWKHKCF